ncbi:MAG: nucleotidyltransferase family protein [Candidatus Caldatribacteriota bacterium]|nr:nucleotidyltransferase family protein [Candidatus Caldatribacteriota bacterium]
MIYGIILAAGEGKRMGKVKLTLPLGDKQLIEWVLQAAKLTPLDKYFLVVRPEDKDIIKIGKSWGAEIVLNPDFRKGMSTSIKKALLKINTQEAEGFFLILGDQPLITPKIINKLMKSFSPGKGEIVVPYFKDKRGNPVLFDICWKDELMAVTGDVGGRVLIKSHPEKVKRVNISEETILFDIDREEDYEKMKNIFDSLHKRGKI